MNNRAKRRILVVDDDLDIRETLELALSDEGFDVVTADSGERALEVAAKGELHAAVTDLKMGGMTGEDTVAGLRRLHPALPVVVITGYASHETASKCRRLGASGVLQKPFDLEALIAMLGPSSRPSTA